MSKKNLLQILILLLVTAVIVAAVLLMGKNGKTLTKDGYYFDTYVSLTVYSTKDSKHLDECLKMCEIYDNLFSPTIEGSDIYNINHANGESVKVDPETYYLLQRALEFCEETEGAVDITVAPLMDIWGLSHESGNLLGNTADKTKPTDADIADTLKRVDYRNVILEDDCCVRLNDPETRMDLGCIAKGYIADRIKELYLKKGATSGIINLGGNVLLVGKKPGSDATSSFNVAIQKPFADDGEAMLTLPLTDKSLVTSGIYDRYFEKDGRIYHHILDVETGLPIENNIYSATIVSDSSVDGDALLTICFSLGIDKGMELIESIPDIHVLYITDDYEIVSSAGFPKSTY